MTQISLITSRYRYHLRSVQSYPRSVKRHHHSRMDISEDIADLSPLEQRRMRLRAFADRVLEAVEALPMPKTAVDSERTLRTITAADRMLVQIYSKVSSQKQIRPYIPRPVGYASAVSAPRTPAPLDMPPPVKEAPFVYTYDDDGVDDEPKAEVEVSPAAPATLDLEQRARDIYQAYYDSLTAAKKEDPQTTGPP